MGESEADRMLRAQREWQGKVQQGEIAPPARKGWKWWHIVLAVVGGLIALGIVADAIEQKTDPVGYAKRQAEREAKRVADEKAAAEAAVAEKAMEEKASADAEKERHAGAL